MSILSTNKKLVRVGSEYSAGENIGINDYVISSRNWSPDITYAAESAFQRANGYTDTQIGALSGEVSAEVSQLGSDIESLSGDVAYISGVALTAHQSLEGYLTKASGDEYYQPIGSYATVSQLESTSGEIVNLIPSIEGLATEEYVNEQTSGKADKSEIPDVSQFITNVSAEQTYQPIGNYLSSNALEGYATTAWVNEQGYITEVNIPESATWQDVSTTVQSNSAQWAEGGGGGDPEVNSFVYNNSADILDVDTTYQENSASYLTSHQDISYKLDTTAFSTVSGDFLTAAPADMATTGDVAELAQTISETYQVKGDYAERDFVLSSIESSTSGKLDVSSFAGVSGDFLTNEDLNGYATESFVENVSGEITDLIPDTSNFITNTSAEETYQPIGNYLSANALEGYATEQWVGEQGYLTEISIPESGNWNEATTTVQTNSSTWDNVTNKLDTTSFSDVSSTFLTAVDLTPYQTIEGMTAYQPAGSYATTNDLEQVSGDITATIPSTAGLASESYVQTNSAVLTGMIDAKQDTLTFGYDEQDRISAINNSAIAGGGEVPEGTMVESNLEYNAVGEISGYGNSAIAQYGAEKQWLTHDDTIVHVSNSAQYAFGVALPNISADLARMMGVDRTLLWSASTPTSAAELSESMYNFESLKFYINMGTNDRPNPVIEIQPNAIMTIGWAQGVEKAYYTLARLTATDNTHIKLDRAKSVNLGVFTATAAESITAQTGAAYQNVMVSIYGIGRKS